MATARMSAGCGTIGTSRQHASTTTSPQSSNRSGPCVKNWRAMMMRPDGERPPIELSDLIKDPSRVTQVDAVHIPGLLTQLSAMQTSMAARLVAATQDAAKEQDDA